MRRAPLIPSGWPSPIAPPFTFSFASSKPNESRAGLELQFLRLVRIRDEDGAGPVVDAARVARGDPAVRLERGRQRREFLQGRVASRVLVRVEHALGTGFVEDRNGDDLPLEASLVDRADRLAVG